MEKVITLAHGAGGAQTASLIGSIFKKYLDNPDFTGSIDFTIDKKAYLSPQREDNTTVPFISP